MISDFVIESNIVLICMDTRVSQFHVESGKSVAEYAYHEDKNFPTRKSMEDSIMTLTKIISLLMIF